MSGWVSLVGAGPGDPELLTLRAARRLAEAELVLYDALVAPEVLGLAQKAQRLYVGKRAGREAIRQETLNRLLIRYARRGLKVVRLKCGDPFVFGRGGEEALALAEAGIACEIVPGVTSALAAPALAGIPVTHRGLTSGFVVVSGHSTSSFAASARGLSPNALTLVVLMGLGHRKEIAAALIALGWRAQTPSAVLWNGSLPSAATWTGRLADLGEAGHPTGDAGAPATICIGEVVAVSSALAAVGADSGTSSGGSDRGRQHGFQ